MRFHYLTSPAFALLVASVATAQSATSRTALAKGTWAITDATIIPMDRDSAIRNATILIRDGRIAEIGPSSRVSVPGNARTIDGRGKWVIPGLVDMLGNIFDDELGTDSVVSYYHGVL